MAVAPGRQPGSSRSGPTAGLRTAAIGATLLELEWSSEQIAAWLRRTFPDQPARRLARVRLARVRLAGGRITPRTWG